MLQLIINKKTLKSGYKIEFILDFTELNISNTVSLKRITMIFDIITRSKGKQPPYL